MSDTPATEAPAENGAENGVAKPTGPTINDLVPRDEPVMIGLVELQLDEPNWFTLTEIAKILLDRKIAQQIKSLTDIARDVLGRDRGEESEEGEQVIKIDGQALLGRLLGPIVDFVVEGVVPLLTENVGQVPAILLDTPLNRQTVAQHLADQGDGRSVAEIFPLDKEENSPAFRRWIVRHMTPEQFDFAIGQFQALRGWGALGKRIASRFGLGGLTTKLLA